MTNSRLQLEETIDKESQALRDELSDQGSQVTEEVKTSIQPQVDELEKKQQAETQAKIAEMQQANDEKVEAMKREVLDVIRAAHKAKVEAAQAEFDAELKAARERMGSHAREQAMQREAKKEATIDALYKQKLEEVRKKIDAVSDVELKQKQAEIRQNQTAELAELEATWSNKQKTQLEPLEAGHKAKLSGIELTERKQYEATTKTMISDQESKLAEAETKIETDIKTKEAADFDNIRRELASAGGSDGGEIPTETEQDMADKTTLRLKRWEMVTEKLETEAVKTLTVQIRSKSRGLRAELQLQRQQRAAASQGVEGAILNAENELQQFKASHKSALQREAPAHQNRMADLRAHAEQRRRDATARFQSSQDELARQQSRQLEAQWTTFCIQQDTTKAETLRMELQVEAQQEAAESAQRLAEMRKRVAEAEAAPSIAASDGGDDGKTAELTNVRRAVQMMKEQHARLNAQIQSLNVQKMELLKADGSQQRSQAWAGVAIADDNEAPPAIDLLPPSDGVSSPSDSSDSSSSWLMFPELTPLEATELSVSFSPHGASSPVDLDQSSVYADPADIARESKRLARAEEFIQGQAYELEARKHSLAQLRATWKRDFKVASSSREGGTDENGASASKSKLALLESVRKMLEQQEQNMRSESSQLQSVSEYLQLRQQKLHLVENSISSPKLPRSNTRSDGGDLAGGDGKLLKRIDGVEQQLKQVVRMLQSRDSAASRARRERETTTAQMMDSDHDRWAAPRGGATSTGGCRVGRGRAAHEMQGSTGINTLGPSKWNNKMPKMVNSGTRPVWDYHKVLAQWAEERDVTRDLLSQHTAWIDTIQRELMKQQ